MGMAASQARFLSLTARKTNTEYEGQQINQQRTTLGNQTANYYNQLLGMSVPTPPSVSDFTKTVYTFDDGALKNSINTLIAQADGSYLMSYTSTWVDDFAAVSSTPSIVTRDISDPLNTVYRIGSQELRPLNMGMTYTYGADTGVTYDKSTKTYYDSSMTPLPSDAVPSLNSKDPYMLSLSAGQVADVKAEEAEYLAKLNEQYGVSDWQVRYVQNSSNGVWSPYFYKKEVLDSATYSDTGSSQSSIPAYTIGSAQRTEEIKGVKARLEQDATGRLINITLNAGEPDEETYALTTNTITDQAAYSDAMNQYEYDKYQYDHSIQEVNTKIEIIQSEDKNLELRLKQLDTEQKAISTEMDAVQKVIEKNVESTFKTFG